MPENPKIDLPIDICGIMEYLPHRYPFLLIDRVIELDNEAMRLVAIKNVTINEPHFAGHYPGLPVMPGVLLIEACAQAAALFMLLQPQNKDKVPYFTGLDAAKFRRQVVPGDQLRIEIHVTRLKARVAKADAIAYVDGEKAVEAKLTCILADPPSE